MVHGKPDWGLSKKSIVYAIDDMAELAARLGSIVTFDRRGDTVFLDGFEDGLIRWTTSGSVAVDTTEARNGARSVKLTVSSAVGLTAHILHQNIYPEMSKVGFEFSWLSTYSTAMYVTNALTVYDGTTVTEYEARYNIQTRVLEVLQADGTYAVVGSNLAVASGISLFVPFKLVIDLATGKYVRVRLGNASYALTTHEGYQSGTTNTYILKTYALVKTTTSSEKTMFFDDAILTQNEP